MDRIKLEKLAVILKNFNVTVFEYFPEEDRMISYNAELEKTREIPDYIHYLQKEPSIFPEDRWKVIEFFKGKTRGSIEIRVTDQKGKLRVKRLNLNPFGLPLPGKDYIGTIRDITQEYELHAELEGKAMRDSLTGLYNHDTGKHLINEYLDHKNPYDSCAMLLLDIDFFKNVNDNYGHLFGDEVLIRLARLLENLFDARDILMRAGGDEFVILIKEIGHVSLLRKTDTLLAEIREMRFEQVDYSMTCSVGISYLPENVSGYNYNQLFDNADWALYQAKERGRNCYAFCDTLQRFEKVARDENSYPDIETRYLHNDIIATAFEIFEKQNSFTDALELLLKVIGARLRLDRITVIQTNIKENRTSRQYMWKSPSAPSVLDTPSSFTKEDFLTLFHSYDEYGTTVLHFDNMEMYSEGARALLMQGGAKSVVYAAMYLEGRYTGAISYVVCDHKRYWSKMQRSQFGELTKIIAAHLARAQALNVCSQSNMALQEFDSLTGLLSYASFREETERFIVGNYASSHMMVYADFYNFHLFNQKFGYQAGDQLLKEFSSFVTKYLMEESEIYVTRVSADHFILFKRFENRERTLQRIGEINRLFLQEERKNYPEHELKIRVGVYFLTGENISASEAIDYARYAREQGGSFPEEVYVGVYDEKMRERRLSEAGMAENLETALENGQFQVYLQPRFDLKNASLSGAEAMVRWRREDGTLLYPRDFLELCEKNGKIIDLDFFVFERVAEFQAKMRGQGRKMIPIAVNASVRHAMNSDTARKYRQILEKYEMEPALLELEFTESEMLLYYDQVKEMMEELQKIHLITTLDDYGSSYSRLNMMIDAPINSVKLDRSFLTACETSEKGIYYLEQIIRSVKGLGYRAVCEGVETKEQAELLKKIGCDEAQGYWFARPMPLEEFERIYGGDEKGEDYIWKKI